MHLCPATEIDSTNGDITAVSILPVISTKKADCGQPEHTLICIATIGGNVMFYLENGILLMEFLFHQSPVRKLHYRGFCHAQERYKKTCI
jgi:hypothetical protein